MGLRIPHLRIKILLETNNLKSIISVRRLAVRAPAGTFRRRWWWCFGYVCLNMCIMIVSIMIVSLNYNMMVVISTNNVVFIIL